MKNLFLFTAIILTGNLFAQPGKYAGSKKSLIKKTYTDSRNITGLKNWQYLGGSVLNNLDDPEMITADIFSYGTTRLIIFSIKENAQDTASKEFVIADVIELKNVLTKHEVKTGVCRNDKIESSETVALVRPANAEYSKAIKAWRFNRDKRKIEIVPATKVDCLNEGFDQT